MAAKSHPSPPRTAMQRITEILARGAGPDRMARVVDDIVARFREEGDAEQAREWMEELAEGFGENAEAALEAVDEIESARKAERAHAERAACSMMACRDAFARHAARAVA